MELAIDKSTIDESTIDESTIEESITKKLVTEIKIFYLYINKNNEIHNIICEDEKLKDHCLSKERLLYLIKQNELNSLIKHKLIGILKFNIDLEQTDLSNLINNNVQTNYLTSLKELDNIPFNETIHILKDLNCIFLIFTNNIHSTHNTTKRINIKTYKKKTRCKTV